MAKKTKQKTVEGGAPPKETPEGTDGLLLAFEVRDVILNGLKKDGMAYLERVLGTKLVAKTDKLPGTPLLGSLVVAGGALLDHWNEEHPTKADIKKADAEAKQAKLETGGGA